MERETAQRVPARQALVAFLQAYAKLPDWEAIYGAHAGSVEFRRLLGDDEAHFVGYAVCGTPGRFACLNALVYLPK